MILQHLIGDYTCCEIVTLSCAFLAGLREGPVAATGFALVCSPMTNDVSPPLSPPRLSTSHFGLKHASPCRCDVELLRRHEKLSPLLDKRRLQRHTRSTRREYLYLCYYSSFLRSQVGRRAPQFWHTGCNRIGLAGYVESLDEKCHREWPRAIILIHG